MARALRQAAVVPYRIRNTHLEVALVTTSSGTRWIVPKGSVKGGERPRDAASREAEEEGGLRGVIARKRLGRYGYLKRDIPCRVDVYLMRVTGVLDHWLEDSFRRRRWLRIGDAVARVREELRPFIHAAQRVIEATPERGKRGPHTILGISEIYPVVDSSPCRPLQAVRRVTPS